MAARHSVRRAETWPPGQAASRAFAGRHRRSGRCHCPAEPGGHSECRDSAPNARRMAHRPSAPRSITAQGEDRAMRAAARPAAPHHCSTIPASRGSPPRRAAMPPTAHTAQPRCAAAWTRERRPAGSAVRATRRRRHRPPARDAARHGWRARAGPQRQRPKRSTPPRSPRRRPSRRAPNGAARAVSPRRARATRGTYTTPATPHAGPTTRARRWPPAHPTHTPPAAPSSRA